VSRKRRRFLMPTHDTYRLFHCARCQKQIRLCRECDRGQRLCDQPCRAEQRRAGQRRAAAVYQLSRRGRGLHAARMQRYRERSRGVVAKFSDEKVTHHTVTQAPAEPRSEQTHAAKGRGANREDKHEQKNSELTLRCTVCRKLLPRWTKRTKPPPPRPSRRRSPRLPTGPPR